MFDLASISAALASAKAIYDLLKGANDAQLAVKISGEVANIQGKLIDVQQQAITLQTENHELREKIRRLEKTIEDEKRFQFMHGVYGRSPRF